MKHITIQELLECLGNQVLEVSGNVENVYIDNLSDVDHVNTTTLDWVNPAKQNKDALVEASNARVLLVDETVMEVPGKVLIRVKNPKVALALVGNAFFVKRTEPGIHPTAIIDDSAFIGENVYIGPYCVIGRAHVGDNCVISSHVSIKDNVFLGCNCYIKEGTVIGGDGFGFVKDDEGHLFRFPQLGGVRIGNFVEIGANTCIDRGALSDTIISDYVKISNLCQIAHNVQIGENTVITACVEISGSCVVGDNVWIGPNCSVRDQRKIGRDTLIGMGAVVSKNIPDNEVWVGCPIRKLRNKE